eukprot:10106347-Lingulodinium_polyedra.AAC.1
MEKGMIYRRRFTCPATAALTERSAAPALCQAAARVAAASPQFGALSAAWVSPASDVAVRRPLGAPT